MIEGVYVSKAQKGPYIAVNLPFLRQINIPLNCCFLKSHYWFISPLTCCMTVWKICEHLPKRLNPNVGKQMPALYIYTIVQLCWLKSPCFNGHSRNPNWRYLPYKAYLNWAKFQKIYPNFYGLTLWLFNIAMENGPFIVNFPIKTSIYKGFSMAMLNNQMVYGTPPF